MNAEKFIEKLKDSLSNNPEDWELRSSEFLVHKRTMIRFRTGRSHQDVLADDACTVYDKGTTVIATVPYGQIEAACEAWFSKRLENRRRKRKQEGEAFLSTFEGFATS